MKTFNEDSAFMSQNSILQFRDYSGNRGGNTTWSKTIGNLKKKKKVNNSMMKRKPQKLL